jgi:hypothetical protein
MDRLDREVRLEIFTDLREGREPKYSRNQMRLSEVRELISAFVEASMIVPETWRALQKKNGLRATPASNKTRSEKAKKWQSVAASEANEIIGRRPDIIKSELARLVTSKVTAKLVANKTWTNGVDSIGDDRVEDFLQSEWEEGRLPAWTNVKLKKGKRGRQVSV